LEGAVTHAWDSISSVEFDSLPSVAEGESKIIRAYDGDLCLIKLKPTVYSFTHNRAGVLLGSDALRLRANRVFLDVLQRAGVSYSYLHVGENYVLARRVASPPPVEVIVKARHVGTPQHRYCGFTGVPVRSSHRAFPGATIADGGAYPEVVVRFDWRNPMRHPVTGERLADEVLCDEQADWFLDTAAARRTAKRAFSALSAFLGGRGIELCDLCLFVTEDGSTIYGEVSQDCGRFRSLELGSLDKDVWRAGGSSERVLEKWRLLNSLIGA
jgi:phosphoribosylaminoimidazole-succinocarboxamide synthase